MAAKKEKDEILSIAYSKMEASESWRQENKCEIEDTFSSGPFAFLKDKLCQSTEACEIFKKLPELVRGDKEFVLKCLTPRHCDNGAWLPMFDNVAFLPACSEALRQDKEVLMAAAKAAGALTLLYAPDALKADKEFVMTALGANPAAFGALDGWAIWCLGYASPELQKDKELVMLLVNGAISDAGWWRGTAQKGGTAQKWFESLHKSIREDKDVVMGLVKKLHSADLLEYASDTLKQDRDLCLVARTLRFAPEVFGGDTELVLNACEDREENHYKGNAEEFKFASDALKGDKEFVLKVFEYAAGAKAFEFASDSLRADSDFILNIPNKWRVTAFQFASDSVKADKDVVLKLGASAFQFASDSVKADKDVVKKLGAETLLYCSDAISADMDLMKTMLAPKRYLQDGTEKAMEVVKISTEKVPSGFYDYSWDAKSPYNSAFSDGWYMYDCIYNDAREIAARVCAGKMPDGELEVDAAGGFKFGTDFKVRPNWAPNMVEAKLEGEKWNSFKSYVPNFPRYCDAEGYDEGKEYLKHPPATFRLKKIVGPFIFWTEEESGSTSKWTFLGSKAYNEGKAAKLAA